MTQRTRSRTSVLLKFTLTLVVMLVMLTCLALGLADLGFRHQADVAQLRAWMKETWWWWFLWRLTLYSATGWGIWRCYRSPNIPPALRQSLLRIAVVSVGFFAICEYSVLR
ncbi:hypothetical protein DS487_16875 [Salmonella enterica subsp. enterica]|nr:hypothetical protein [Salmonella enterica subsp. enterica serovar Hvittingfoss]